MTYCIPIKRGCGTRTKGALYFTTGIDSAGGKVVEDFLICPPVPAPDRINLTPLGVRLFVRENEAGEFVTHIADWVGSDSYPNVADFIEEVRRFGLSRKIPQTIFKQKKVWGYDRVLRKSVEMLTPPFTAESHIFLAHRRAFIENGICYVQDVPFACPTETDEHVPGTTGDDLHCLGLCYQDVEGGNAIPGHLFPRAVMRTMPSFKYVGYAPPSPGVGQYSEQPAFFASFPCTALELVAGNAAQNASAAAAAGAHNLPLRIVNQ